MKLTIGEDRCFIAKEVYDSLILETAEGNKFAICMRDDTVEMTVVGSNEWYRADMRNGAIYPLISSRENREGLTQNHSNEGST